jgi:hypothetical protein
MKRKAERKEGAHLCPKRVRSRGKNASAMRRFLTKKPMKKRSIHKVFEHFEEAFSLKRCHEKEGRKERRGALMPEASKVKRQKRFSYAQIFNEKADEKAEHT